LRRRDDPTAFAASINALRIVRGMNETENAIVQKQPTLRRRFFDVRQAMSTICAAPGRCVPTNFLARKPPICHPKATLPNTLW
jgi:hypothetical protein